MRKRNHKAANVHVLVNNIFFLVIKYFWYLSLQLNLFPPSWVQPPWTLFPSWVGRHRLSSSLSEVGSVGPRTRQLSRQLDNCRDNLTTLQEQQIDTNFFVAIYVMTTPFWHRRAYIFSIFFYGPEALTRCRYREAKKLRRAKHCSLASCGLTSTAP